MDPDANLEEMRSLVGELVDNEFEVDSDKAMRLVELVAALDEWISRGGFLPSQWTMKARVLR